MLDQPKNLVSCSNNFVECPYDPHFTGKMDKVEPVPFEKDPSLSQDVLNAIKNSFENNVDDFDDWFISLCFRDFFVEVKHGCIMVYSDFALGTAQGGAITVDPGIEKIFEDIKRTIRFRDGLIPLGYTVIQQGALDDGSYRFGLGKNIETRVTEPLLQELMKLKKVVDSLYKKSRKRIEQ